ncbi:Glycosyltransferase involved in cell wall bisynthesis [Butyrivibrio fibrisolvens]|uniref:Glycosyltransferase involved in cell wall bisynthesis n=1 Tax=Butyrivibrio fibrisolvens TaxID=831 RepID=A0A1H9UMG4_BUTFI|nr:glycosyltransferase family 1 protein [Butyrivibrio fibrisolvens]SES10539.1 Glycosyltransferase involved in cell wall bisynthesis [Butyrivibrio fibrisolvens]
MANKVLFFVDRMRVGGIQIFLLNLLKNFDAQKIQCEYLVLDDGNEYEYEEKFKELGGTVHKLKGVWLDNPLGFVKYCKAMDKFFKKHHDYVAIHMNASSKNFMLFYYARKYGVKKRIIHSHSSGFTTSSTAKILIGNVLKKPLLSLSTDLFACSGVAAEWLFGKRVMDSGIVKIIPNAIDLNQFEFDPIRREKIRKELKISDDTILIGHIGRFSKMKNHKFLLEIFKQIHDTNPNSRLVLAGIGELLENTKEYAKKLEIDSYVDFLGFRNDVMDLTQAIDVFVMPSLYEGFPVTGIESQASGCPCVFSDTITREAALLDETIYLSLQDSVEKWATEILSLVGKVDRKKTKAILKDKGFDIGDVCEYLVNYYTS